jgi:hypothetical protein
MKTSAHEMRRTTRRIGSGALLCALFAACSGPPAVPVQPTWADVQPILRGQCDGCHGSNAKQTGSSYRLDLYEVNGGVCGDAALAIEPGVLLAGFPTVPDLIRSDIVAAAGAPRPRMPPAPAPALPDWQLQTLERWVTSPVKGPAPSQNRAPTISTNGLPAMADETLTFTASLEDADGDPVIGVIEVAGYAFLMNRGGSFAVDFDSSSWPAGVVRPTAVLCDGWTKATYDLGPLEITHAHH